MKKSLRVILAVVSVIVLVAVTGFLVVQENAMVMGFYSIKHDKAVTLCEASLADDTNTDMLFNGSLIPYDKSTNTYYVFQPEKDVFTGNLQAKNNKLEVYVTQDGAGQLYFLFEQNKTYKMSPVVLSGVPLLNITLDDFDAQAQAKIIMDGATEKPINNGKYTMFSPAENSNKADMTQTGHLNLSLRGKTSLNFDKKGYKVSVVDKKGEKKNVSFLDMRDDDDWILNPLYSDNTKIKEKFAYSIWDDMTAQSDNLNQKSSRLEYVELFINGEYQGVYGLQERVDAKQVGLDKDNDLMYKCTTERIPIEAEFIEQMDTDECGYWELAFAPSDMQGGYWHYLKNYIDTYWGVLLETEDTVSWDKANEVSDVQNTIDYYIFKQVLLAMDNGFKNTFYYADASKDGQITRIPWDVNFVLGDVYFNEPPIFSQYQSGWQTAELLQDIEFDQLYLAHPEQTAELLSERWGIMKETVFNEENINKLLRENHEFLLVNDVYTRDTAKWQECGTAFSIDALVSETLQRVEFFDSVVADMAK